MMLRRPSGLGRGLGALIPPKAMPSNQAPQNEPDLESVVEPVENRVAENPVAAPAVAEWSPDEAPSIRFIPVENIVPNPHQPRTYFDHQGMEDLVSSIKEHGILQPLVASPRGDGRYELIAGERRLRAAMISEMPTVPVIVRSVTEQQKLELALIENVQRRNLNPIEEARAYVRLREEFDLTQDQVGERVGKSRPQVGNIIRLLELEPEVQDAVANEKISQSNARTLLSIPDPSERRQLFMRMLEGNFTVRQAEAHIPQARRRMRIEDPNVLDLEARLRASFGLKVQIKRRSDGEGEVRIQFQNDEDLQRIAQTIEPNRE